MHEDSLKIRLKNLNSDLTFSSKEANMLIGLLTDSVEDKEELMKHLYFSDNAPVKVLTGEHVSGGNGDMTAEIIDVCMGYDKYAKNIGREAYNLLDRHNKALKIFLLMLRLPYPFSQILYLKYFKNKSVDEVCDELYLSKSGYYRKYERAITLLLEQINS